MFLYYVGSGGLCDELITSSDKPYRVRVYVSVCVYMCNLQISTTRRPRLQMFSHTQKKYKYYSPLGSQDSAVGIMTRLRAGRARERIPAWAIDLSVLQNVQTDSAAQPASYYMGTAVLFRD